MRRIAFLLTLLALSLAAVAQVLAAPNPGRRDTASASALKGKTLVFSVKRLRGREIRTARLRILGKSRAVSSSGLERAARRGTLRVAARPAVRRRVARLRGARRKRWLKAHTRLTAFSLPRDAAAAGPPPEAEPRPTGPPAASGGLGLVGTEIGCFPLYGSFAAGRWPSACWRPYASDSPWNRRLPARPTLDPRSASVVAGLMRATAKAGGRPKALIAGQEKYGHPTYWSGATDPSYRVHCLMPWGRCEVEGMRVRIPARARAVTGSDAHLTVVDQLGGWEYDFWQARPRKDGVLNVSWGGRTPIGPDHGDGLGSNATAGHFGLLAGQVRAEELQAERIDHALMMVVPCANGHRVYPAGGVGRECSEIGRSNADAPAMGARFLLAMSEEEIDALPAPGWRKAIYRAMARYGMYVGDTGNGSWAITQESDLTYTSFGQPNKWVDFARRVGAEQYPGYPYYLSYGDGIDWGRRLQVVSPCVAARLC